jgi:hypothetical protein
MMSQNRKSKYSGPGTLQFCQRKLSLHGKLDQRYFFTIWSFGQKKCTAKAEKYHDQTAY